MDFKKVGESEEKMRISAKTKQEIKHSILQIITKDRQTTNQVAQTINRAWEITDRLLKELEEDGKIKSFEVVRKEWVRR